MVPCPDVMWFLQSDPCNLLHSVPLSHGPPVIITIRHHIIYFTMSRGIEQLFPFPSEVDFIPLIN